MTAEKQHECFKETMKLPGSVGIRVLAVSVDNAATNRKFYVDCLQRLTTDTASTQPRDNLSFCHSTQSTT